MRYTEITGDLRARLACGALAAGGALESEAVLGRRYAASRVTIRRALTTLRDEGLLVSRKGAGWFVAADPVRQDLGRMTTIEGALTAAGITPTRRVLAFGFEQATAEIAAALLLPREADVLRVQRLNLAGDAPFAVVTVWLPAEHGARLSRDDVERATFYDVLPLRGVALGGAAQTISAAAADRDDARLLGVPLGSPLLACRRITRDTSGRPVLFSEHRYPGHRTLFEVEIPHVAAGSAWGPSGVRLLAPSAEATA
jgi:GntR family transcriptional regulator